MKKAIAIAIVIGVLLGSFVITHAITQRNFDVEIQVQAPPPNLVIVGPTAFVGQVEQGSAVPFDITLMNEGVTDIDFEVTITGTVPDGMFPTEPDCCLYTILAGATVIYSWQVIVADTVPVGTYPFILVFDDPVTP